MTRILALPALLVWFAASTATAADAPACRSTVTGDLHLHTLQSQVFRNSRTIRVLLPDDYDTPANKDRRYPVLYLLDGQNLFDACLSDVSHREWQVDETVRRLTAEGRIPPMIVVGVDHAGADRAREYLPYPDYASDPDMQPQGRRFPDFLVHEVMPLVNANYRTLTGHANTGLGGSSYGGVATLYALMARPMEFGYGLIESPSLQIGMGQLVRDTNPFIARPVRIFMGFGGLEAEDPMFQALMVGLCRTVESNLRAQGYDESMLRFVVTPGARHTEDSWAARLPDALTFMFSDWKAPAK
ncbi:MAG: alpha/beta hydrolase-fold protein [Steroidobacteraceae bacterium]